MKGHRLSRRRVQTRFITLSIASFLLHRQHRFSPWIGLRQSQTRYRRAHSVIDSRISMLRPPLYTHTRCVYIFRAYTRCRGKQCSIPLRARAHVVVSWRFGKRENARACTVVNSQQSYDRCSGRTRNALECCKTRKRVEPVLATFFPSHYRIFRACEHKAQRFLEGARFAIIATRRESRQVENLAVIRRVTWSSPQDVVRRMRTPSSESQFLSGHPVHVFTAFRDGVSVQRETSAAIAAAPLKFARDSSLIMPRSVDACQCTRARRDVAMGHRSRRRCCCCSPFDRPADIPGGF